MQLSDEEFREICEKISRQSYDFFKKKVSKELESLSRKNSGMINENTIVNIILTSLALFDGNIIILCRNICADIKTDKLLKSHSSLMEKVLNAATIK